MSRSVINLAAVIMIVASVGPVSAQSPRTSDRPWQAWLVRVEHVHRRDLQPNDVERLEDLAKNVEQADNPRAKSAAERQLEQMRIGAAARAGFVVYGWSMHADSFGRSVSETSSMSCFFVPGGLDAERLIGGMQPGDCIAIDRRGAQELFTFEGRKFIRAQRGVAARNNTKLKSQAFALPPERPLSPAQESIETKLTYYDTVPQNNNRNNWHKYTVRVQADRTATTRSELTVWLHARFIGPNGDVFGPIIVSFEVRRSPSTGGFDMTRSFGIICLPGFDVAPKETTIDLIGAR